MLQLIGIASAFLITLFMFLGGIANIQENLGEYRRQLDVEGFEGLTVGFVNQAILKNGGLFPFLRTNCPAGFNREEGGQVQTEATLVQFNPVIRADCLQGEADIQAILGIALKDGRIKTNDLRVLQKLNTIPADLSEISFKFTLTRPGLKLWEFAPIAADTRMMNISYLEADAEVYLKKNNEMVQVFAFKKVFRP